jgi:protoporphyrinogen IX oxidase
MVISPGGRARILTNPCPADHGRRLWHILRARCRARFGESALLWLKAFHVVFVVTWFAGLFYLPRLFVYHVSASDEISRSRFVIMERRLFIMTSIGGALTLLFGILMIALAPGYLTQGWLHLKLSLVLALIGYQGWCLQLMHGLREGRNGHSERWYRLFNEVPGLLLIAIVILAVVKPSMG